ncbi:hypothetical protein FACS1894217_01740 [Clostridia bacterium]|nr:hypothetical protein FACS1894217_01740 [Clostridia bacterium]
MPSIIIAIVVAAAIGVAIWRIVRGAKKGGNCGCGCDSCAAGDICGKNK